MDTPFTEEIRGREDHPITVGDLRAAIEGVPDDMPVRVDTGFRGGEEHYGIDLANYWYMDELKTVSPVDRVRPQAISFSHTGKLIIEL